jgi:polar amino acid transport system substrate-binding protein
MRLIRTTWTTALALAIGTAAAVAGKLDDIKAKGEFVYGLEAQYKPFEFRDENNEIIGYDVDVANEIAKRIGGVSAKPMDTNWSTVIQSLYNGEFDVIIGGMTATQKRYERVNFSVPYMDASSGLLVKADSGITGPKDLAGKTVAAGAGTPQLNQFALAAEEHGIAYNGEVKSFDNDAVAYEAFNAGRIDAYASTVVSLLEFAKANPGYTVLPFTSTKWTQEWTAMAFTKEAEDFRSEVNKHLLAMKADGTLKALQEKWFGQSFVDTLPDEPPTW